MSEGSRVDALAGWSQVSRKPNAGQIVVQLLRDDGARLEVLLAPPSPGPALERLPFANVSYANGTTLDAATAGRVTKAFVRQIAAHPARAEYFPWAVGASGLPVRGERTQHGVSDGPARPGGFSAEHVALLLAPEVVVGGAPFHGYVLRELQGEAARCVISLEGTRAELPSLVLSLEYSSLGFRVGDGLGLILRSVGGEDPPASPTPAVTTVGVELAVLLHEHEATRRLQRQMPPMPALPTPGSPRVFRTENASLAAHTFALNASGFTVLPNIVGPEALREIADAADRAMQATRRRVAEGGQIPKDLFEHDYYFGARHLHLWSDNALRFLEHPQVRDLSEAVIGPHKLFEMVLLTSLPAPHVDWLGTEGWHRDVEPIVGTPYRTHYLWFMLLIDDYREDNGATWVVPGSHRLDSSELTAPPGGPGRFPSRVQALAKAGDVLVIDPSTLHSRGHNRSAHPRRMLNVMLCHQSTRLLENHWEHAGRKVRAGASPAIREMLGGPPPGADESAAPAQSDVPIVEAQLYYGRRSPAWPALPDDWQE